MNEQTQERKRRLPPAAIAGIVVAVLIGISLYIRIALPYHQVFANGRLWFLETDSYWYMRNIENLVHHFPRFNAFDPYMIFPGGGVALIRPFFAWLVSGTILLVSHGATTLYHMEVIAAYVPAILGGLTLIPVYFIGKELFNRWVGVISAALVGILPGEFLHRSLLGFTDHHVAETLFTAVSALFLIMAIKRAREREMSFGHILSRDWSTIRRPLIYMLLAAIFLGFYLLTWQGGLLFVFIIFVYLVIQFVVDHMTRKSSDYLCIIGTPFFLIAFLMILPLLGSGSFEELYRVSMPIAILVPVLLSVISRLMAGRALKFVYYPLALLALLGIGLAAFHAINPVLLRSMLDKFSIFTPAGAWLTVMEMQPLLFPSGQFTLLIAWANFTTSFFISFISFGMLIYFAIKEKSADKTLFLVWSMAMLIAVLGQRRFGYYYAVNAALLTGYFSWKMLDLAGLNKLLAKSKEVVIAVKKFKKKGKKIKEKAKPKTFMQPRGAWVRVIVVGIVIFFAVFFPNIGMVKEIAGAPGIMNEGWYSACLWLRDNSPEPFSDPNSYYEIYPPQNEFKYPATAYGVMSWWDYGYFIMQIAHRIPNANPGQVGAVQAGQFFTADNESYADQLADKLGTKYVMIDNAMATPAKFYAMAEWAGSNGSKFYGIYYVPTSSSGGQWAYLFYPTYYNSLVVRLYNFDSQAVNATQPIVISYQNKVTTAGQAYMEVTGAKSFSSYEEAQAYVASQTSGNYRIVGTSPFTSIVPLQAMNDYQLVYSSGDTTNTTTVKVFKYLGGS